MSINFLGQAGLQQQQHNVEADNVANPPSGVPSNPAEVIGAEVINSPASQEEAYRKAAAEIILKNIDPETIKYLEQRNEFLGQVTPPKETPKIMNLEELSNNTAKHGNTRE